MAPQAGIGEKAPTTLPPDFDSWDSDKPPAVLPDNFDEFDADVVEVASPPTPAKQERPVTLPVQSRPVPSRDKSRDTVPTRTPAKRLPDAEEPATTLSPRRAKAARESESSRKTETTGKAKNTIVFVAIGVILVLIALIGVKFYRPASQPVATNQAPAPAPAETSATAAPVPQSAVTQPTPSAAPAPQPGQPTPAVAPDLRRPVGTEMMNQQLNAPSRISPNVKNPQRDAPPPSGFAGSGMEGMGGNPQVGNVFGKHNAPVVQRAPEAPHKITVSAGAIQSMLVQKPAPVYPQLAKSAHISGTVVLQVTISKTGATEDVRVVSGPTVLRQAAVDAVRNWRYKPYVVNNEPTEVEGQASVRFETSQ
jgi:protein TonB